MAVFNYNNMLHADFDDRTLAHLERVIVGKMRRHESFHFAWTSEEGARSAVWLSDGIPLSFEYDEPVSDINRAWLESLMACASGTSGLTIVPEPDALGERPATVHPLTHAA
ncbi:ATP-dependent DNA ligase [Planctomonas sp. JC2975]|uniref:DUF7882 family protein n=1 Tax=Planctomonas sp. JC2975 TaxID=2729626 RepID=UPI001476167B|nr:ATP-dependent DNA ligase [Planctomonas sp. JC2975]NNC13984.1 ATP-dependent DNA ligase [Planctomonas sp. JC2975]